MAKNDSTERLESLRISEPEPLLSTQVTPSVRIVWRNDASNSNEDISRLWKGRRKSSTPKKRIDQSPSPYDSPSNSQLLLNEIELDPLAVYNRTQLEDDIELGEEETSLKKPDNPISSSTSNTRKGYIKGDPNSKLSDMPSVKSLREFYEKQRQKAEEEQLLTHTPKKQKLNTDESTVFYSVEDKKVTPKSESLQSTKQKTTELKAKITKTEQRRMSESEDFQNTTKQTTKQQNIHKDGTDRMNLSFKEVSVSEETKELENNENENKYLNFEPIDNAPPMIQEFQKINLPSVKNILAKFERSVSTPEFIDSVGLSSKTDLIDNNYVSSYNIDDRKKSAPPPDEIKVTQTEPPVKKLQKAAKKSTVVSVLLQRFEAIAKQNKKSPEESMLDNKSVELNIKIEEYNDNKAKTKLSGEISETEKSQKSQTSSVIGKKADENISSIVKEEINRSANLQIESNLIAGNSHKIFKSKSSTDIIINNTKTQSLRNKTKSLSKSESNPQLQLHNYPNDAVGKTPKLSIHSTSISTSKVNETAPSSISSENVDGSSRSNKHFVRQLSVKDLLEKFEHNSQTNILSFDEKTKSRTLQEKSLQKEINQPLQDTKHEVLIATSNSKTKSLDTNKAKGHESTLKIKSSKENINSVNIKEDEKEIIKPVKEKHAEGVFKENIESEIIKITPTNVIKNNTEIDSSKTNILHNPISKEKIELKSSEEKITESTKYRSEKVITISETSIGENKEVTDSIPSKQIVSNNTSKTKSLEKNDREETINIVSEKIITSTATNKVSKINDSTDSEPTKQNVPNHMMKNSEEKCIKEATELKSKTVEATSSEQDDKIIKIKDSSKSVQQNISNETKKIQSKKEKDVKETPKAKPEKVESMSTNSENNLENSPSACEAVQQSVDKHTSETKRKDMKNKERTEREVITTKTSDIKVENIMDDKNSNQQDEDDIAIKKKTLNEKISKDMSVNKTESVKTMTTKTFENNSEISVSVINKKIINDSLPTNDISENNSSQQIKDNRLVMISLNPEINKHDTTGNDNLGNTLIAESKTRAQSLGTTSTSRHLDLLEKFVQSETGEDLPRSQLAKIADNEPTSQVDTQKQNITKATINLSNMVHSPDSFRKVRKLSKDEEAFFKRSFNTGLQYYSSLQGHTRIKAAAAASKLTNAKSNETSSIKLAGKKVRQLYKDELQFFNGVQQKKVKRSGSDVSDKVSVAASSFNSENNTSVETDTNSSIARNEMSFDELNIDEELMQSTANEIYNAKIFEDSDNSICEIIDSKNTLSISLEEQDFPITSTPICLSPVSSIPSSPTPQEFKDINDKGFKDSSRETNPITNTKEDGCAISDEAAISVMLDEFDFDFDNTITDISILLIAGMLIYGLSKLFTK